MGPTPPMGTWASLETSEKLLKTPLKMAKILWEATSDILYDVSIFVYTIGTANSVSYRFWHFQAFLGIVN